MKGLIFSIEEFAVFDGDGIRVNVFFKGCPLRCKWCHNPEGWSPERQIIHNPNLCTGCGKCRSLCGSRDKCLLCGKCMYSCPNKAIRISGTEWEAAALAKRILKLKPILSRSGGGVTFSGGEVFMQYGFLCEMLTLTAELNRAVETSGFCSEDDFRNVLGNVDFVFFDLKVMDSDKHRFYTGADNSRILSNARILMDSDVPYIFRVPYIHGVNTDEENLCRMAEFLSAYTKQKPAIEFLPYNTLAGAKYAMLGMKYEYEFDRPDEHDTELAYKILSDYNVSFRK